MDIISIDIVYLDGPTDPIFHQIKKEIFAERNCCLHFVLCEIKAMKFETNSFDYIILLKQFHN